MVMDYLDRFPYYRYKNVLLGKIVASSSDYIHCVQIYFLVEPWIDPVSGEMRSLCPTPIYVRCIGPEIYLNKKLYPDFVILQYPTNVPEHFRWYYIIDDILYLFMFLNNIEIKSRK